LVQAVYDNYKTTKKFVDHVNSYGLNKKLNMDFQGEGRPSHKLQIKNWSNISLPWMALVMEFLLHLINLYNAVANNVMVHFVSEIKEWNRTIKKWRSKSLIKRFAHRNFSKSKSCSS
jgi:cell division protein FtsI (penicillin-binding protein 3)